MVYRGCDIGSAKPSKSTLKKFPHEMIDMVNPDEVFTVADFCNISLKLITRAHLEKKLPLFVGGSMMYFKSLLDGMHELPERDNKYRDKLEKLKESNEKRYLFSLLNDKDPEYAKGLNENDEIRIIRALEVIQKTGEPLSKTLKENKNNPLSEKYNIEQFGILDERQLLHKRIEERLKSIMSDGLEHEAIEILKKYKIPDNHPIRKSINYKQIFEYIDGRYDIETFFQKALFATRQLAKRQITWMRSWDTYTEIRMNDLKVVEDKLKNIISLL